MAPGRYALLSFPRRSLAASAGALASLPRRALAGLVLEPEGGTLLLPEARLAEVRRRVPGGRVQRGFRVISFRCAMDWSVVGFLARVAGALAAEGIPVGIVCSFDFDHVFVPSRRLASARRAIARALRIA